MEDTNFLGQKAPRTRRAIEKTDRLFIVPWDGSGKESQKVQRKMR